MDVITLDLGNSHPHFAHFKAGELHCVKSVSLLPVYLQEHAHLTFSFAQSTVGAKNEYVDKLHPTDFHQHFLAGQFLDMPVAYAPTLGEDRLYQSYYLYKNKLKAAASPILLVDAGTFLTCDLITSEGYQGGHIFPGVRNYFSLYQRGAQLHDYIPQEIVWGERPTELPHHSRDAILQAGRLHYEALFKEIRRAYPAQSIYLTGGEAPLFKGWLGEWGIEVQQEEHLIHHALYDLHHRLHGRN